MLIKLISSNKQNNLRLYCEIDHSNYSKINKSFSVFKYDNEIIFKYLLNIKNDRLNLTILTHSIFEKDFHKKIIGTFIFDKAKVFNVSSLSINCTIVNLTDDIIFGFFQKDFIYNKYLSDNKPSIFQHNYKFKNKRYAYLLESLKYLKKLVSEPSNIIYPESFAKLAVKSVNKKNVSTKILDYYRIKKLGLNCLLAVNQGSQKKPCVIEFCSKNQKKNVDILFVGKGVCFDSGGISIKPSAGMEDMKWDMAGAAVVSAIIQYLSNFKNNFSFAGIIGLVENMPSGSAYKPGDIIKSYKGINVEVLNTDAEGRLVLADIISYGCYIYKPKLIIDFATLTGAIMIALGQHYAGLYSNDDQLAEVLYQSSLKTNEKVWRMPLHEDFNKELNSPFVDLKNITNNRYGGSVTAAQFIQRFVPKNTKWAHLDIAGVTWKNSGDLMNNKGATGFGLTLISDFIDKYF